MKPVIWLGSSRKDLKTFPKAVRRDIGQALYAAQRGVTYPSAKPLRGFGSSQVHEIVDRHRTDTYRAVYTVRFRGFLYVLHAFQKKAKKGARTPKADIDMIKRRIAQARNDYLQRQGVND